MAKKVSRNHVNQCDAPNSHRTAKDKQMPIAKITGDTMNGSIVAKPLLAIVGRYAIGFSSLTSSAWERTAREAPACLSPLPLDPM